MGVDADKRALWKSVRANGGQSCADMTVTTCDGRVLDVPSNVREMHLDLSEQRLIRLIGRDHRGREVERYLRITGKGGITVV